MSNENEQSSPVVSPTSLKQKLKSSLRLPWISRHHKNNHHHHQDGGVTQSASTTPRDAAPSPSPGAYRQSPRLSRALSQTWHKTSPELKDKCRNLINRIGHHHGHGPGHRHSHNHGRRHSADFRYDASSYALNFDEGSDGSQLDEFRIRNFTSRLPPSPPTPTPPSSSTSREITALTS